jgi:hypothetical protein
MQQEYARLFERLLAKLVFMSYQAIRRLVSVRYFSSSDSDACSLHILLVEIVFTTSCLLVGLFEGSSSHTPL